MSLELEWKAHNDGGWWEAQSQKWNYSVSVRWNEAGMVWFEAERSSTNDGLSCEEIGHIEAKCASLEEAKATISAWHQYRYRDNDAEFSEYGGNTSEAEDADTEEWRGKFTCKSCGKTITDAYDIQGFLYHKCDECLECRQESPVFWKKGKGSGDFSNS
jgi:hypothetical protein